MFEGILQNIEKKNNRSTIVLQTRTSKICARCERSYGETETPTYFVLFVGFGLKQILANDPAATQNVACFESGQNWPQNVTWF